MGKQHKAARLSFLSPPQRRLLGLATLLLLLLLLLLLARWVVRSPRPPPPAPPLTRPLLGRDIEQVLAGHRSCISFFRGPRLPAAPVWQALATRVVRHLRGLEAQDAWRSHSEVLVVYALLESTRGPEDRDAQLVNLAFFLNHAILAHPSSIPMPNILLVVYKDALSKDVLEVIEFLQAHHPKVRVMNVGRFSSAICAFGMALSKALQSSNPRKERGTLAYDLNEDLFPVDNTFRVPNIQFPGSTSLPFPSVSRFIFLSSEARGPFVANGVTWFDLMMGALNEETKLSGPLVMGGRFPRSHAFVVDSEGLQTLWSTLSCSGAFQTFSPAEEEEKLSVPLVNAGYTLHAFPLLMERDGLSNVVKGQMPTVFEIMFLENAGAALATDKKLMTFSEELTCRKMVLEA